MIELSVSVTLGNGCEQHNHDSGYRLTLDHVLVMDGGELELVPYNAYNSYINNLLRPAIDEYNARRQSKYQEELDRYANGERANKPKKQAYLPISYDYAGDHERRYIRNPSTNRVESMPLYREIIIKIGGIDERVSGKLPDDVAILMCKDIITKIVDSFPMFKIIGCTAHMNELGTIHLHIDFVPISQKPAWKTGLPVSLGLNNALAQMGYTPETSIMCAKTERAPILFNAFRNRVYRICEEALVNHGYRMQYEATVKNYPSLDPSAQRSLSEFQTLADHARWIQHCRNVTLEFLAAENLQLGDLSSAIKAYARITESIFNIKNVSSQVCEFAYEVTEDLLFKYHSCCQKIVEQEVEKARLLNQRTTSAADNVRELLRIVDELTDHCNRLEERKAELESTIVDLQAHIPQLPDSAIVSEKKRINESGFQLISKREYNALVRVAESVNEITTKNKELIAHDQEQQRNIKYLEQCCIRMENLLRQYAPQHADRDIQWAKRDLSDITVRDYYNNELVQIEKAKETLEAIIEKSKRTIDEVGAVLDTRTENQHCSNTKQPSLDLQVKMVTLRAQGNQMLSGQAVHVVYELGRLIGLKHDEITQLVDYALFSDSRGKQKALAVWHESQQKFWASYHSSQQDISVCLDDLYRKKRLLIQTEWLLDPYNSSMGLWGVLFAIIIRLSMHTTLSDVEASIAYYKAARERLQRYTSEYAKACETAAEHLHESDINGYLDAIHQMHEYADLAFLAVLDIPLERQYVITKEGLVSKAELKRRLEIERS